MHVSRSPDPPSPSPSLDDEQDAYAMLSGWEDEYHRLRGWPSPVREDFFADRLTDCACWLMDHLDGVLASPIAEPFGKEVEVMAWYRQLVEKAKAGRRREPKPLRCPGCQLLTLSSMEGDRYVACDSCGLLLTRDEYDPEVERRAGEARRDAA